MSTRKSEKSNQKEGADERVFRTSLAEYRASIAEAVNVTKPLPELLTECANITCEQFELACAQIWVFDQFLGKATLTASVEITNKTSRVMNSETKAEPSTGKSINTAFQSHRAPVHAKARIKAESFFELSKPTVISNFEGDFFNGTSEKQSKRQSERSAQSDVNDPSFDATWATTEGIQTVIVLPLMLGDKSVGVFALFSRKLWSREETIACEQVTTTIAQCISRKKSEEQLIASERRFRIFAENVDECLFISAPQLVEHYYISPAFENIWGLPVSVAYEDPFVWANSIVPEHKERVLEYVSKLKGYEMPEPEIEYQIVRADGQRIWLNVKIFAVLGQHDGSYHICGSVRDTTQRKAAETRVNQFYTTVSHELRTPLTSIKGALLLLERGKAGSLSKSAEQLILLGRRECDRLIRMINDMLDIKKIEVGKLQLYRQNVSAADLVTNTLQILTAVAAERKVELRHELLTDALVNADKDRIVQVLTNLIFNAVKFSPFGSVVKVRVERLNEAVRFSVVDLGPGIAKREQKKLFVVFEQVDQNRVGPREGLGLGLAICKGIVDEHGGAIGVVSEEGKGATFWFDLPIGLPED